MGKRFGSALAAWRQAAKPGSPVRITIHSKSEDPIYIDAGTFCLLDGPLIQFLQLYGKLTKKNQPDYKYAMKAMPAQDMYNSFLDLLKANYEPAKIKVGVFGAMMDVALVNDGPVTIVIESDVAVKPPTASAEDDE